MAISKKKKSAAAHHRFKKLMSNWGRKTRKIARLNTKIIRLGSPGAMKPKLSVKFAKLMDQLAFYRNKELNIISKINAVEKRHHYLRQHKGLKSIRPRPLRNGANAVRSRKRAKDRNTFWLFILWLLLLAPRPKKVQKRPSPQAG